VRSSLDTVCGGIRAIFAMMSSTSFLPTVFLRLDSGRIRWAAPRLVDHIDRLVGQVPVVDVAGR